MKKLVTAILSVVIFAAALVRAGQGIYILAACNSKDNSDVVLKPQSIKSDNLIKELSGSYDDVKKKLI